MSITLAREVYRNPKVWPSVQAASEMLRQRCLAELERRAAVEAAQAHLAHGFERLAA